jgi:hypothetical protein
MARHAFKSPAAGSLATFFPTGSVPAALKERLALADPHPSILLTVERCDFCRTFLPNR